jgi:hypothetical protein
MSDGTGLISAFRQAVPPRGGFVSACLVAGVGSAAGDAPEWVRVTAT